MLQTTETSSHPFARRSLGQVGATLAQEIAEAVREPGTPISRLLRLMAALDASDADDAGLRAQLRTRIGAPRCV